MITFDDVRKTTETTFFFFPDGMHDLFTHFLTINGFSEGQDFVILSSAETKRKYPDMYVPLVPTHPSLAGNPGAYAEPVTMVSRMDIKDLERKLWEIDGSEEAIEWDEQRVEEMLAEEQARNERLKGWGPGLTRESEDMTKRSSAAEQRLHMVMDESDAPYAPSEYTWTLEDDLISIRFAREHGITFEPGSHLDRISKMMDKKPN